MGITNQPIRRLFITLSGAAFLAVAGTASAHEPDNPHSIDEVTVVEQISAHDARRPAYEYMEALGYVSGGTIGGAKVRDVTREGDTFIVRVAYSAGSRVMSKRAVLYINAATAVVSEQPPKNSEGRVASN